MALTNISSWLIIVLSTSRLCLWETKPLLQHPIAFRLFKSALEKQTGFAIKKVRSDNGHEFLGEFYEYFKEIGIQHRFTVPYAYQQNGNAERNIQTISFKMKVLFQGGCVPEKYWPLAFDTATFYHNVLNVSATKSTSPFKQLFPKVKDFFERGRKPHTFGALCFCDVLDTEYFFLLFFKLFLTLTVTHCWARPNAWPKATTNANVKYITF